MQIAVVVVARTPGSRASIRNQVAPVGGGVDQQVGRAGGDRSIERRLERLVGGVRRLEGQVVAKDDVAFGPRRHQVGDQRPGRRARPCRPRSGAGPGRRSAPGSALTSEDLPVPRAPVSSTLLAGRPRDELFAYSVRMILRSRSTPSDCPAGLDGAESAAASRARSPCCASGRPRAASQSIACGAGGRMASIRSKNWCAPRRAWGLRRSSNCRFGFFVGVISKNHPAPQYAFASQAPKSRGVLLGHHCGSRR